MRKFTLSKCSGHMNQGYQNNAWGDFKQIHGRLKKNCLNFKRVYPALYNSHPRPLRCKFFSSLYFISTFNSLQNLICILLSVN